MSGNGRFAAMAVHGETYIVTYREGDEERALQHVAAWADDSRIQFNWYHAAAMARFIREARQTQ